MDKQMVDYEPLDLSGVYNAGVDVYRPLPDPYSDTRLHTGEDVPPLGAQSFHGLPFRIGDAGGPCLIALGSAEGCSMGAVQIPVGRTARYVVFAHALLETDLFEGGPVGETIVMAVFRYADGEVLEVPVRERFEVGNIPLYWGQYPFLCLADQQHFLLPRRSGDWEQAGFRLTEASQGWPRGYYIWPWKNPHLEKEIDSIVIMPGEKKYILAGITLGHLEERPLPRSARRAVRVTLTDEERAAGPFEIEVDVDRGVATYPYPLPDRPFFEQPDSLPGFGAAFNRASSPFYTEVAASDSATIRVSQSGEELGAVGWGELQEAGRLEVSGSRFELIDSGKNWVHVRVRDADTGETVPCRVAFYSPEGMPYAPHGHHGTVYSNLHNWNLDVGGDVRLGQLTYAYIDGTCRGWLPRGRVYVEIARGFEYEPVRRWVEIEEGQERLDLEIRRWIRMADQGYYSGDSHVHFLSTQGGHFEAAGEDLNVLNLLLSQWGHYFSNTEEFTGRPSVSHGGETIVYASQENRQHILGHLSLLGLKEPVMPWGSGGPSEAELGGGLDITMSHWADMCHAQGGTVILPHLPTPNGEPAAMIATGRVDAVEMLEHGGYEHLEYYRYLNAGYRLPLVGGTDKMSSATPVGLYRTYVHIPPEQEFNYENWTAGLRAGRTFLSGGPMIWLEVEGQPIGSTLQVEVGGHIEIRARAESAFPIHSLQIVMGGEVIEEVEEAGGGRALQLAARVKVEADTWIAARCAGPGYAAAKHHDRRRRGMFAHTSPVYIRTGEAYRLLEPASARYMLTLVEGSLAYIREASPQYAPGSVGYHHGREDHLRYLEEPFLEAREALHRRMHRMGIPH